MFEGNVVDCSTVLRWSARFREERVSTEDTPRIGKRSIVTYYTSEVIVNDINGIIAIDRVLQGMSVIGAY